MGSWSWLVCPVVLAVAIYYIFPTTITTTTTTTTTASSNSQPFHIASRIDAALLSKAALLDVAHTRRPVILTHTPAQQWRAMREWTFEYMQAHIGDGNVSAYVHPHLGDADSESMADFITYHDHKPLEPLLLHGASKLSIRDMHTTRLTVPLMELIRNNSDDGDNHGSGSNSGSGSGSGNRTRYMHFSMSLDDIASSWENVWEDLDPLDPFFVSQEGKQVSEILCCDVI